MREAFWICRTHVFDPDEYFCSACRGFAKRAYAFCPSCGSRMTAVQEDDSEEWDELDEIEFLLEEEEDEW